MVRRFSYITIANVLYGKAFLLTFFFFVFVSKTAVDIFLLFLLPRDINSGVPRGRVHGNLVRFL